MAQEGQNLDQDVEKKILENMTEGVVWTSKGDVVYMNDSARKLMDLPEADTGKKFAQIFVNRKENDNFVQSVIDSLSQKEGVSNVTDSDFVTEDGKQMRFHLVNTSMKDEKRKGILSVITDITEVTRMQEQQKEATRIVAAFFAFLCGFLLLYRFFIDYLPETGSVYLSRISEYGAVLLCVMLFPKTFVWEMKNRVFFKGAWKGIRSGLILTGIGVALMIVVKLILISRFPSGKSFFDFSYFFIGSTHFYYPLTVFVQEFIARCFLLESMKRTYVGKHSSVLAVLTTSLIFAVFHVSHNFIYMILAGVLMGALGGFYLKTKNLWSTIIVHYVLGEMIYILSFVGA